MLVIRNAQLHALSAPRLRAFESWMVTHIHKHFPTKAQALSADALSAFVSRSLQRAFAMRIDRFSSLCKFVDLELWFGEDFVRNPNHPWAAEIVDRSPLAPNDRIDSLMDAAIERVESQGLAS